MVSELVQFFLHIPREEKDREAYKSGEHQDDALENLRRELQKASRSCLHISALLQSLLSFATRATSTLKTKFIFRSESSWVFPFFLFA